MDRLEFISSFLCVKDLAYELLEWIEHISDEDFSCLMENSCVLPPEVESKLERLGEVQGTILHWFAEYQAACRNS